MSDYLETFLPAYYNRYLNFPVTIEPAPYASVPPKDPGEDWLSYFESLRDQVTWGYDAFFTVTDLPYSQVTPEAFTAGEDFYWMHPNWGWTSAANWDHIDALRAAHPELAYMRADRWYTQMIGVAPNVGINALAVVGHEITHAVLLASLGWDASAAIDGGYLSGLALLDEGLSDVSASIEDTGSYRYVVQRVTEGLTCRSNMGAYPRGSSYSSLFQLR
jgi:hypothetical protein